jgi:protocatechuate 3,4-dioxygenase beta subunit
MGPWSNPEPHPYGAVYSRRRLLLAAPLLLLPGALAAQQRRPTPRTTLGPFYPDVLPAERDADLSTVAGQPARALGTLLYVQGQVTDIRGKPMPKARLELWQANDKGRYIHTADTDASGPLDPGFQGYGALLTDAQGRYRFKTIKPAAEAARAPHLHFIATAGGERLVTQMFFEGEKLNGRDALFRSLDREAQRALTGAWAERAPDMEADALAVAWDIVLSA